MINPAEVLPVVNYPSIPESLKAKALILAQSIGALLDDIEPCIRWTFDGDEWCGSIVAGQKDGLVRVECIGEFCQCGAEHRWRVSKFGSAAGVRWHCLSSEEFPVDTGEDASHLVAVVVRRMLSAGDGEAV